MNFSEDKAGQNNIISLSDIVNHVNNVNLDDEIVVINENSIFNEHGSHFPLRIDALVIVLCTQGHSRIGIDLMEYDVRRNSMIVIHPQNYLSLLEFSEDSRMRAVVCSKRIVEGVLPKLTELLPMMMHTRIQPVNHLNDDEANGMAAFYDFLKHKLQGERTPFLKPKVMCVLQAALFEMMDISCSHDVDKVLPRTRKEEIMARFLLAVSQNFRTQRLVGDYAKQLCITPKHLSAMVKEVSGRTAGDWIESYVTMEAKVLLRTTDLTIQEIAQQLNFTNQSFFGKYFKHQTGMSPTVYRSSK